MIDRETRQALTTVMLAGGCVIGYIAAVIVMIRVVTYGV